MRPNPHSVKSSVRKKFFDNFVRNNTENDLGIVSDGSRWDNVRGVFRVLFNRAVVNTDPSDFPIATVNMPFQDVSMDLYDIGNGAGASLWVSDAGNWWATVVEQTVVDCNCDTDIRCDRYNASNITGYNTFQTGGGNAFTVQTGETCTGGNVAQQGFYFDYVEGGYCRRYAAGTPPVCVERNPTYFVMGYNATTYNRRVCTPNFTTQYNARNFANAIAGYNAKTCAQFTEFTINCETCYPQWIRVIQSTANTVSTVTSFLVSKTFRTVTSSFGNLQLFVQDDLNDPEVASMKVSTQGQKISIEVFEGNDLTNKIELDEEITYTPTGAQLESTYGIIVRPANYNPKQSFDRIDITKN